MRDHAVRVAMFTNTYLPHVGGVAGSVSNFESDLRRRGHDVRIIAPQFAGAEESTRHVLRTPAIQKFNGSDFSVQIPQPGLIADFLDDFRPQVVHSHHPFLLGDAALRAAWVRRLPLVFTHHTLYEQYTHYVPLDSEALKGFVIQMVTEYCNLCSHVIAPSESVDKLLVERDVDTPITVIPTGIDFERFASGDRAGFRRRFGIDDEAVVIGHVGRLAAEKNLDYLARAAGLYLAAHPESRFVVVGAGEHTESMRDVLLQRARPEQIIMTGAQTGQSLADAYAAMDLFVFSSQSETQGMVLAEAMAAGTPAVALDGPGVRDVVNDSNGRLLPASASEEAFAMAIADSTKDRHELMSRRDAVQSSIDDFRLESCADRLLDVYDRLITEFQVRADADPDPWDRLLRRLEIEWNLLSEKTAALRATMTEPTVVARTRSE
jgi:1,2-diacylglycerol 3-alpha-glucosyltransferase